MVTFWLYLTKATTWKVPQAFPSLLGTISRALAGCNKWPPLLSDWSCPLPRTTWIVITASSRPPSSCPPATPPKSLLPTAAWVRSYLCSTQNLLRISHHFQNKNLHLLLLLQGPGISLRETVRWATKGPQGHVNKEFPINTDGSPPASLPFSVLGASSFKHVFLGGHLGVSLSGFESWIYPFSSCVTLDPFPHL